MELIETTTHALAVRPRSVWIDLDNSPHVPFFAPIIEELRRRGHSVVVTARDCFQVCELADLLGVEYRQVGRHYGKNTILKLVGLCIRTAQLMPTVLRDKPDVALSHGSRSQLLLSTLMNVPSIVVVDYEFVKGFGAIHPTCMMFPEVISARPTKSRVMKYPGIKEDVYVPRFKPNPAIMAELGVNPGDLLVTLRPPANEAHYHNAESEALLEAVIELLARRPSTKVVLLPRNKKQEMSIRKMHPEVFVNGRFMVPHRAVDGLNLIWYSDLVISGGGTMNREAAALGVPVYSIFRGEIGAVDRYLESAGRLVLLKSADEVRTRLVLKQRNRPAEPENGNHGALKAIVDNVVNVLESTCKRK
jgi:predicted glycosyltransferase